MQLFDELNINKGLSIALGFFDGVHKGHQKVIESAVNFAKDNNLKSAVITFKDHPCCYFYNTTPKYILTREKRREKISQLGIDYMYEINFDEKLSKIDAENYLKDILVKHFEPKAISTGFNHYFGALKSGNADFLQNNQEKYNYKYFEIEPQKYQNEIISSSIIRSAITNGDISKANSMLGYRFGVNGIIIEGQKLGRKLGYKTANIKYPKELIEIPFGVYEVETNYGKGIANFGIRPTVNNSKNKVLETHILNFDQDIYDKIINIEFVNMIRQEQKFSSKDELIKQIQDDIKNISKV